MRPPFGSLVPVLTCLVRAALAADVAVGAVPPEEAAVEVICPGVHMPVRPAPNGPLRSEWRPPELVAVVSELPGAYPRRGDAPVGEADGEPSDEYLVKRVLYGSHPGKTIRIEGDGDIHWVAYPGDHLVAVVPGFFQEQAEFLGRYSLPLSEERAEAAFCQARLDYATLSSVCIFVGKQVSLDWADRSENDDRLWRSMVEVVRVIHGSMLRPSRKVRVAGDDVLGTSGSKRRPVPEPRIYFTSPGEPAKGGKAFYNVYTHLPVDQEPKVREALGRRNQYPVLEREENGRKIKCR